MESGAKFTDDTLGLDHLLLFHDNLRTQSTNSKLKVYANISIMTSLPKASLYKANDVSIFPIFGRSYMIFFRSHRHLSIYYFVPLY